MTITDLLQNMLARYAAASSGACLTEAQPAGMASMTTGLGAALHPVIQ